MVNFFQFVRYPSLMNWMLPLGLDKKNAFDSVAVSSVTLLTGDSQPTISDTWLRVAS